MKSILLFLTILTLSSFAAKKLNFVRDDKTYLLNQLQETKAKLLKSVEGLSDAQMQFKPASDRWSVAECMEHIIRSEKSIFDMEQQVVKQPANPDKRKEIKLKDEEMIKMLEDRSRKGKAQEPVQPKGMYTSSAAAIQAFTQQRDQVIDYATSTNDDLRNHVMEKFFAGPIDAYQILLLLAGHSARHTLQIEEVKSDPAFPKQ